MNPATFVYRPGALPELQAAIRSAIEGGSPRVVIDLDGLVELDAANARDLILVLRRSREIGGEVALRTSKPAIGQGLAAMALDRLFPMVNAA
jgi:anti-anti-sigma regulatory factor